jgi:hypothetical protein
MVRTPEEERRLHGQNPSRRRRLHYTAARTRNYVANDDQKNRAVRMTGTQATTRRKTRKGLHGEN